MSKQANFPILFFLQFAIFAHFSTTLNKLRKDVYSSWLYIYGVSIYQWSTVEALVRGQPRARIKGPELAAYKNVKIQSLYGSSIKRGFD